MVAQTSAFGQAVLAQSLPNNSPEDEESDEEEQESDGDGVITWR